MEGLESIFVFAGGVVILLAIIIVCIAMALVYANKSSNKIKEINSRSLTNYLQVIRTTKPISIFSASSTIFHKGKYNQCLKLERRVYLAIIVALLVSLFLFLWTAFFSINGTANLLMLIGAGLITIIVEISQIITRETYEKTKKLIAVIESEDKRLNETYGTINH